jgi:hypothetical protein
MVSKKVDILNFKNSEYVKQTKSLKNYIFILKLPFILLFVEFFFVIIIFQKDHAAF